MQTLTQFECSFFLFQIPGGDCSYLITGGDDKMIRFWNLQNIASSYTVCGPSVIAGAKPFYTTHNQDNIVVYEEHPEAVTTSSAAATSHASKLRGPAFPAPHHRESVMDVKVMEMPHRMLISAGRDGVVKVWK